MILLEPNSPKGNIMGMNTEKWYKYHRVWGIHTDDYHHLKQEIEKLREVVCRDICREAVEAQKEEDHHREKYGERPLPSKKHRVCRKSGDRVRHVIL